MNYFFGGIISLRGMHQSIFQQLFNIILVLHSPPALVSFRKYFLQYSVFVQPPMSGYLNTISIKQHFEDVKCGKVSQKKSSQAPTGKVKTFLRQAPRWALN
eukprot:TRINITY_DN21179_c0_g1_i2.p3 TRINITY_DN21179_c0_g1~~TRINITY_DN21179_c0_g1_i2.p3  ORF type:complete len:101 (-),score=2.23 TRINITY_DN21179_c0_g1_i2:460-762(-)